MVCIGKHKENVLEDRHEELLKELARRVGISFGDIGNQLKTHIEASVFNLAVVVLTCPHARINDKLELSVVEFEKSYKTNINF
jgi:hypothetical protein